MTSLAPSSSFNWQIDRLEPRRLLSATPAGDSFTQTNIVSDGAVPATHMDPNLKNPWGISFLPGGPFWISDNNAAMASVYDAAGNKVLSVNIPGGGGMPGTPTGQVQNPTGAFVISKGSASRPATFLFAGEDGAITGWNGSVDDANAIIAKDNSLSGAVYKGLAMATLKHKPILYAANFNTGQIEMYDGAFQRVTRKGAFVDPHLPAGFAPFNVQNLGDGLLAVTFARQDAPKHDPVAGRGHGVVDLFSTSGVLLRRMRRGNYMNSPWGATFAPSGFGPFAGDLLVGMFDSGRTAVFHPKNGKFLGYLDDAKGNAVQNDGMWALQFGNGGSGGDPGTLFFTAGLNHEADGLFGSLAPAGATPASNGLIANNPTLGVSTFGTPSFGFDTFAADPLNNMMLAPLPGSIMFGGMNMTGLFSDTMMM